MRRTLGIVMIIIGAALGLSILVGFSSVRSFSLNAPEEIGRALGSLTATLFSGTLAFFMIWGGIKFVKRNDENTE
jgi:hypothetical protein